jgi:hypothetical protein
MGILPPRHFHLSDLKQVDDQRQAPIGRPALDLCGSLFDCHLVVSLALYYHEILQSFKKRLIESILNGWHESAGSVPSLTNL